MKIIRLPLIMVLTLMLVSAVFSQSRKVKTVLLPNGWRLSPAGRSVSLSSDFPLNMAVSPGSRYLAVTNNGHGKEGIDLINLKTNRLVNKVEIGKAWLGISFEKKRPYLYVSGGNDNIIIRYELRSGKLVNKDTIRLGGAWPLEHISPAGLAIDENRHLLYAVTKENNTLYICNLLSMKKVRSVKLSSQAYSCLLNQSGKELYISAWGAAKIWIYNSDLKKIVDSVITGEHPNDLVLSKNSKWLFVANANSNSVSVIDVFKRKNIETLDAALYPMAPIGSTTNSVALTPDDHTLYVANADNNCLAVFDVSHPGQSRSKGYIPTGWYPSSVKVAGNRVLVLNGKGMTTFPNHQGNWEGYPRYKKDRSPEKIIWDKFHGTLSIIPLPSKEELTRYSMQVYKNTPYSNKKETSAPGEVGNPVPMKKGGYSPIKYVFYILKENKTYDQVLGDMPQGNGDSSMAIFGKKVTPNSHALADQFVLLDNFYVDGEVSVDGHCWSMAGYATDFVEKSWRSDYSGRGGADDFETAGPIANATQGYIWDYCQRYHVSFRDYGEFMDHEIHFLPVLLIPSNVCKKFPAWNLGITDLYREKVFEHDFDSLVSINKLRQMNTIYLPNDHTMGLVRDSLTPKAYIADNDLALGKMVEYISHSSVWKESAIFVIEDDAANGPDHVDAHRSVAWLISPYVKRHKVIHTMYSTSSVLRTMELILGLPPMSQYDAGANPMWNCFQPRLDLLPYTALPAEVNTLERYTASVTGFVPVRHLDFSRPDHVPPMLFNQMLWTSVKGVKSLVPVPRRAAFVNVHD